MSDFFPLEKDQQGGPLDEFLPYSCLMNHYSFASFFQTQFQLARLVQVQFRTEISLIISVKLPTPPRQVYLSHLQATLEAEI